jgi:hypothetical protein
MEEEATPALFEMIARLDKDLKASSRLLTDAEARYLVDLYYQLQDFRIQGKNQARASETAPEPNLLVGWMAGNFKTLEGDIKRAMDVYSESRLPGRWAKSIVGIGPVLSGGLLAHVDVSRSTTAGKLWSFAGLEPNTVWAKGQKRPWNARLKVLAWKIGESFVKVSNNKGDVYGKIYRRRKDLEIARNESGAFAPQAEAVLAAKKIGHETEAYKAYSQGLLPPAHIHARARRYAVKIFLAHYQEVAYWDRFGVAPPAPWAFVYGGHTDRIPVPNWPLPGMTRMPEGREPEPAIVWRVPPPVEKWRFDPPEICEV